MTFTYYLFFLSLLLLEMKVPMERNQNFHITCMRITKLHVYACSARKFNIKIEWEGRGGEGGLKGQKCYSLPFLMAE